MFKSMSLLRLVNGFLACVFSLGAFHAALSYPSNVRLGYPSCQACHVSPTGGGTVNAYGRIASQDMSTFGYEGSGKALWGYWDTPDWLDLGGDLRYLGIVRDSQLTHFPMQLDGELVLKPSKNLALVTGAGLYRSKDNFQRRRHYVLFARKLWYARFGRFFPAYGLMIEDHTRINRSGLGYNQGQESYNAEIAIRNQHGEINVARVFGPAPAFVTNRDGDYGFETDDPEGYTARATWYASKYVQLGLSHRRLWVQNVESSLTFGGFGLAGYGPIYGMVQIDGDPRRSFLLVYARGGFVPVQGFHLRADFQYSSDQGSTLGGGVQWFFAAHVELMLQVDYPLEEGLPRAIGLIHYWL